ncbi:MAG: DUF3305 domain-containing protein [Pseudomonadota bacterium]
MTQTLDSKELSIDIGVVIARETVDHAWETERWRPVSVLLNPPPCPEWRELVRGDSYVHWHAANVSLTLHRKQTADYQVNLLHGEPVIYIVLQENADDPDGPQLIVHEATVSPFDAQAHTDSGDEIIEAVAMPDAIRELVRAFVAEHHVEEPFKKRKRNRGPREETYQFGKEPIVELRARLRAGGQDLPET